MAQPYNYMLDMPNPSDAFAKSLASGFNLAANVDQVQQQRALAAEKQAQQAQMQADIHETVANPSYETIGKLQLKYPQYHEAFKNAWGTINDGEKQSIGSIASQGFAALDNNKPDVSIDLLEKAAIGYDNVGLKKNADVARGYIKMIQNNPSAAKLSLGQLWLAADENGFKTYSEQKRANELQPYDVAKTQAETSKIRAETQGQAIENQYKPQQMQSGINQTQSQTALNYANIQNMAERLKLDKDKLQTDAEFKFMELNPSNVKLSDGTMKLVNDSVLASTASEQMAAQQESLANNIEAQGGGYGLFSGLSERLAKATGSQDAMTELRNEYTRIRNSAAIKSLPPGPATDKDIELALKGMPPETADSKTISSFLRGMAKLNKRDAAYQQMQAEWANQVGHMGSSKRDVEVMGVKVPAGMNFGTFASKNLNQALKQQSNQAIDRQIATGQRSYMSAVQ